tara:strand:+ start:361 stop:663 length:303 start_codon:yes stop_codon:yes gene_type:complete
MATVHLICQFGSPKFLEPYNEKIENCRLIETEDLLKFLKKSLQYRPDGTEWAELRVVAYLDDPKDGNPIGYHLDHQFLKFFYEDFGKDLKVSIDTDIFLG